MMSIKRSVGRLAEARFVSPTTSEELSRFMGDIRTLVSGSAERLAFCTDWRDVTIFSDDEIDTLVWIMRRDNPKVEANAILIEAKNTKLRAQVERITKESGNSGRRVFSDAGELVTFLSAMLTPSERVRLSQFLEHRGT